MRRMHDIQRETLISEKEEILQRCELCNRQLFFNGRVQPIIHKNKEGHESLKSEAMAKLIRNKAAESDGILVEMISALVDFTIVKISNIMLKYIQMWQYTGGHKTFHSTV